MNFGRMLTAMVTPFDENLEVNYDMAAKLAEYLLEQGNDGIVVNGTTGESPTLNDDEKVQMFRTVKQTVGEKAVVIAGTGSNDTHHSIELTQKAAECGVDGIMLVVPYYSKPSQEGLYQHFKTVAAATDLPIILYNIPGRCGTNLAPETVVRLANDVPNIVAIKEASGNLDQIARLKTMCPADFAIYSGDDSLTLPILSIGGAGIISVVAHVAGKDLRKMVDAYFAGNVAEAQEINMKLYDIFKTMFITSNPVPVKYALNRIGINVGGVRLPLFEANDAEKAKIDASLSNLGLL